MPTQSPTPGTTTTLNNGPSTLHVQSTPAPTPVLLNNGPAGVVIQPQPLEPTPTASPTLGPPKELQFGPSPTLVPTTVITPFVPPVSTIATINFVLETTQISTLNQGTDPFTSLNVIGQRQSSERHLLIMGDYSCALGTPLLFLSGKNKIFKPDGSIAYALPSEYVFLNREMVIDQSRNHIFAIVFSLHTGFHVLVEASPNSDGILNIVGSVTFPSNIQLGGVDLDLEKNEVWVAANTADSDDMAFLYKYSYPITDSDIGDPVHTVLDAVFTDIAIHLSTGPRWCNSC
jgi:hypothetical protein